MKTSKTVTMPPKVLAFANLLKSGKFTQKDLVKKTGYSPKSISNLISTVHNRPGLVDPKVKGIPGFKVERNKDGVRVYTIVRAAPKAKAPKEAAPASIQAAPVTE